MPHTLLSLIMLCTQKAVLTSSILGRSHHLAPLRAKADITGMTLLTRWPWAQDLLNNLCPPAFPSCLICTLKSLLVLYWGRWASKSFWLKKNHTLSNSPLTYVDFISDEVKWQWVDTGCKIGTGRYETSTCGCPVRVIDKGEPIYWDKRAYNFKKITQLTHG